MQKLVFAAVGFVLGAIAGGAGAYWLLEEDFERQLSVMLVLHGDRKTVACQQPEGKRPKNLDCRGFEK